MVPQFNHILYATDLSGSARKAMGYAVALANAFEAALSVIYVISKTASNAELLMAAFLGYHNEEELKAKSRGQITSEVKDRVSGICHELGCQLPACRFNLADVIVEFGHPMDIILQQTETGPYDLLVMGRHDYGPIETAIIGHSKKALLRHCPIPVMLVPVGNPSGADRTGDD